MLGVQLGGQCAFRLSREKVLPPEGPLGLLVCDQADDGDMVMSPGVFPKDAGKEDGGGGPSL